MELDYCLAKKNPVPSLTARFAAQEAFQKTWFESHGWQDAWVEFAGVKPVIQVSPVLHKIMLEKHWQAHLSLSHTLENAVATIILESYGTLSQVTMERTT